MNKKLNTKGYIIGRYVDKVDNFPRNLIRHPDGKLIKSGIYDYNLEEELANLPDVSDWPVRSDRNKDKMEFLDQEISKTLTMENNMTNVAEILKDCPKGTELYCTLIGDCEFIQLDAAGILIKYSDLYVRLTPEGKYLDSGELVLFPSKENRDWSTFKYTKRFKKGDFIYNDDFICIYNGINKNSEIQFFAFIPFYWNKNTPKERYDVRPTEKPKIGIGYISNYTRLATEDEKTLLLSAIEHEGCVWDAEKLELRKKEPEFKPFDKVLVRDFDDSKWIPALYGFKGPSPMQHIVAGGTKWKLCVPYEGNEHLLGTTEKL